MKKIKKGDLICREDGAVCEVKKITEDVVHIQSGGFIRFEDIDGWWELLPNGNYVRQNHEKVAK